MRNERMFELLNDLFIRSNDDDDDEYDDNDDDDDGVNEEEGGGEEEESDAAATIIAQANGAGGGGEAAVAQSTETTTTATVAVVVEEEDDDDDDDELESKDVDDDDNPSCEENDGHGDADDVEDDEWNGLFQEFKTGMFSLTSSVSAVSTVAAEVFTGALEEAQTSLTTTTSLIMSAGAGRPPFVLSAAEEDDGDVYYYEDDGDEMVATKSGSLEDGPYEFGEGIEEDEDEEVNFLEAPRISNEENDPRRYKTIPKLESLDIVKMRQRLMSAEEKRNTLMQMVDARNEEICMLRFELDQCTQRRLRRQSDLESNIAFTGTSCSSDDRIQWLKRETQWWRHLISSNTNDASMKALSTTISQLRDDLRHSNANGCSVRETIIASENVIRDLRLRIQTIKDNTKK